MSKSAVQPLQVLEKWRQNLADLIDRHFAALLGEEPTDVKIPELIKMIELHGKSERGDAETKAFWAHIEKIRRRKQAERKAAAPAEGESLEQVGGTDEAVVKPDSAAAGE